MGFLEDFFDALGEDRTVNVARHLILGKVFSKEYSRSRKLGNHPVQNVLQGHADPIKHNMRSFYDRVEDRKKMTKGVVLLLHEKGRRV
jgi:hypothetical protein